MDCSNTTNCTGSDFVCIVKNCSGCIGAGSALQTYWQQHDCPAAYAQLMNTDFNGELNYNPVGAETVQVEVFNLFQTYLTTNTITDDVTSSQYSNFQETLLSLCLNPTVPGACELFLTAYCQGGIAGYTGFSREQAISSPTLTNFCGCYVPADPKYLQFTLGSSGCNFGTGCTAGCTAGNSGCTGQFACDPLCHRAQTSHRANLQYGTIITCPQTICVIDNVTINIANSRVPGGINFNSICSGCGGASGGDGCLCVVSGVNISETASSIGIGLNFNEFCGGSSVCLVEDSAGNVISTGGCTGIDPANMGIPASAYLPNLGIIFILLIVVIIIFFLIMLERSNDQKPVIVSS